MAKKKHTFTINFNREKNKLDVEPHDGPTILFPGDTVEIRVGEGWHPGDDPYVWRLHPYAPKAEEKGPNTSIGQGVWQCDCASADGDGDPPLSVLYSVTPKPSREARPRTVTLTNQETTLPSGSEDDPHWLTGRIAWGPKPSDPCEHGRGERANLPFDPELINRSGTPPNRWTRIYRSALALRRRSSQ